MRLLHYCLSLSLICFLSSLAFAGGWPREKDSYYFKLAEWWLVSERHFDSFGEVRANTHTFGYYSTYLYGEYGFTNRLTGILYFPVLNYTYSLPPSMAGKLSAWETGDAEAGLQFGLTDPQQGIAVSFTFSIGIPTGKERGDLSGGLQTGEGVFRQKLRLDAGTGFTAFQAPAWINAYGGYQHKAAPYVDEIHYGLEAGINMSDGQVMLVGRLAGISATSRSDQQINSQSLFSNYREYLSFSPEVSYYFNESWGMSAGVGTALSGRNIFASPTFTLGIFYKK